MSKIHEVIPKIMAEVGAIEKGRKNQQQNYAFRGIDDAYTAFQPAFAKFGVFVVPTVTNSLREERQTQKGGVLIYTTLTVKHTFFADDGSSIDCVTVGEAMDSGDKSSNKAMSAAMKYALLEVFCVPTEGDNDTENHSPEPLPKQSKPASKPAEPQKPEPKPHASVMALGDGETCTITRTLAYYHAAKAGKKLGTVEFKDDPTVYAIDPAKCVGKTGEELTITVTAHAITGKDACWYEVTEIVPF